MMPCFPRKALLLTVLFLTTQAGSSWAAEAPSTTPVPSAPGRTVPLQDPAGKFVQGLGDRAIAVVSNKTLTPDVRNEKLRALLRDSFDLHTIGRFVIGRTWLTATPEQQKEYIDLFEALVIRSYGDRLALYTGEGFEVTGARPETEKDTNVTSQIVHPDGSQPTSIDWRIRQRDGKYGVIDVVVEGISLSVTQRQEYAAIIQKDGGRIDGLLAMMRQQVGPGKQQAH